MYYNHDSTFPVPVHPTWDIQDTSKVQLGMRCLRRYFYKYVLGWNSEAPNIHLIFGSAWHEAMAHLLLNDYSTTSVVEAFDKLLAHFRNHFSQDDDEIYSPKNPERAFMALATYAKHYASDNARPVEHNGQKMVEIAGKISLTDDMEIAFKQDSILEDERGKFSREHKTASSLWNWDEQWYLSPQVGTYHFVLDSLYSAEEVVGVQMNAVAFKRTKANAKRDAADPGRHFDFQRVNIYKNPDQMQLWYSNMIWWLDLIKMNFNELSNCSDSDRTLFCFPQNPTDCTSYGRTCQYADFCRFWANPLQHLDRLPIGMHVEFWNPLEEPVNVELNIERGGHE